ncbi:SIR2 family protein [Siminovitchia acidinfaciens]|uniref:SIR2 family protein n=1 Tax=Siminovitchia acidinfaciens TaxID=2321395 RepID=UPI0013DE9A3D|nr:SIR2 family protein [Siminovitchia acidinfaciens]
MEKDYFLNFNNLDLSPTERSYYFEKFILLNIEELAKAKRKVLFIEPLLKTISNRTLRFDAIIPEGVLELEGPVLLEVKNSFNYINISKLIKSIFELENNIHFGTFLICIGTELDYNTKTKIYDILESNNSKSFNLVIWDINDIKNQFKKNMVFNKISEENDLENLDLIYYTKQAERPDNNSRNNSEILKGIYNNEHISLFLGSGVSKDCGLPLWDELIGRLSSGIISNLMDLDLHYTEKNLLTKELSDLLSNNPLLSASYLERGFSNTYSKKVKKGKGKGKVSFNNKIHENLYSQFNNLENKESQIFKIAESILQSTSNKGIKKVITYNYDDLLQLCLNKLNPSCEVQTIYKDSNREPRQFPIYHVHGFLPQRMENYPEYNIDEQEIIFTEDSYYKLQNEPYSWRNLTQINAFREDTVLMIGLSLTDPNIRRLLMQTSQQTDKKHFILLHRYSGSTSKNLEDLIPKVTNKFLDLHHHILEENFKKLGVNVIWYENHSDIADLLTDIFGLPVKV